jgi:hypothetical protein
MQTYSNSAVLTNIPVTGHVILGHVAIQYRARRETNFQNTLRPACAYATREVHPPFPPLLASLAVGGFQRIRKGMYAAAARACANAVATTSACGAFEVGTGASGFERLTGSPSDSGAGAPSSSGALRLPSDTAGGRVSCGGMLDEGTLVPRGIQLEI